MRRIAPAETALRDKNPRKKADFVLEARNAGG
jgi:hypothetical protein